MNVKFEKRWLRRYLFVGMAALSMLILNSNSAFAAVIAHYDFEGDLIDKSPLGGHDGTGGATFVDSGTFSGMAYDVIAGATLFLIIRLIFSDTVVKMDLIVTPARAVRPTQSRQQQGRQHRWRCDFIRTAAMKACLWDLARAVHVFTSHRGLPDQPRR